VAHVRGSVIATACVLALVGTIIAPARAEPVLAAVTPPTLTGPLPVSAASYPFNAADHNVSPSNLAANGYVEREYIVSGRANVYGWLSVSPPTAQVWVPNAPYTSRILVRRPSAADHFSGRVAVELLNPSYGFDVEFLWPSMHRQMLAEGDAWIGITYAPTSVSALKRFDSARYGTLSMANPKPPSQTCAAPNGGSTPDVETGLAWDMLSAVGSLLRTPGGTNPLAGLTVQKMYAMGYSASANALVTYANAFGKQVSLADGRPIFDGYLIAAAVGAATAINQCTSWVPPGDPRNVIQPNRVPIIRVNTSNDFGWYFAGPPGVGVSSANTLNRRADNDAPTDRFRLYEVPGATHLWIGPTPDMPGGPELARIGATPINDPCPEQPPNNFPLHYFLDSSYKNLDIWARGGAPPPRADRIQLNNAGTYSETTALDWYSNPIGGVRSPYVDVPIATYVNWSRGQGCGSWGHPVRFPDSLLASLYPTHDTYVGKVIDSTFALVQQGWLTEPDARDIILEATHADIGK